MLATAAVLSAVQAKRVESLPRWATLAPSRTGLLEGFRQRNAALDAAFYDIGKIAGEEAEMLSPWLAAEGMILMVPPTGTGPLRLCPTTEDFAINGGAEIRTLAIAGVGSSALGAAALARNVADATGAPVATVVSGYGIADVATEALGGFFWFGPLNCIRRFFEPIDIATQVEPAMGAVDAEDYAAPGHSRDTRTVMGLLADERLAFDLLTGHSKGSLILSEALYGLLGRDEARARALARTVRIVTFSARIYMPRPFRHIVDVMGELDWFGELNSRQDLDIDVSVKGAWHHTNTELPAHLPVTETLRGILAATRPAPPSSMS